MLTEPPVPPEKQKCGDCPLRDDASKRCPAHWDWDGFCGHVAREVGQPSRYWTGKLLKLAGQPVAEPGLARKAVTLAVAVVKHVADGRRIAPPEIQFERAALCESNVCGMHDPVNDKCIKCGCTFPAKRQWASEACPLGHWDAV